MMEYSFDTTVGELLDTPATMALIEELCPGLLTHPMLERGRAYPVSLVLPYFEEYVPKEQIEAFRLRLEAL